MWYVCVCLVLWASAILSVLKSFSPYFSFTFVHSATLSTRCAHTFFTFVSTRSACRPFFQFSYWIQLSSAHKSHQINSRKIGKIPWTYLGRALIFSDQVFFVCSELCIIQFIRYKLFYCNRFLWFLISKWHQLAHGRNFSFVVLPFSPVRIRLEIGRTSQAWNQSKTKQTSR